MSGNIDIWGADDADDAVAPAPDFAGGHADDPEDELLAPVIHDDGADDVEEDTEDDGGISDAEGIVRVWVEDSRLVRVRVAPTWYTKLERRRGATLGKVLTVVLQMAHVGVAAPGAATQPPELELTPEFKRSLPELSEASLARMQELQEQLQDRFEAAKRERAASRTAPSVATVGRAPGVAVRLDARGNATAVEFDETWLDTAQAGQIGNAVMRAAKDAYARYRPPADDDELTSVMAREYEYMRQVMYTIMTPKERR